MAKPTWKAILKRLERLRESGAPLIDVDGKPVRGDFGEYIKHFTFPDALDELIDIFLRQAPGPASGRFQSCVVGR